MRFRDNIMRKGNLTSWIAVLCLAAAGMPAAAQQSPSVLNRVRNMLGQSAAPKAAPAAAPAPVQTPKPTGQPSAPPVAPAPLQTPKPAATPPPAAPPADRPAAPAAKPVHGPTAPSAPAASAESHGASKPAGNLPVKTASTAAPGAKGAPANIPVKPGAANSKLISAAPNPKAAGEAKADVPRDIPKAAAIPGIVPVKENIARRDPFTPLLAKESGGNGAPQNLPPGKPGLMIGSLHIDGIVNGPNGMIAIVSNPQQRVYFLREDDHLYDGQVEHITMDGISFHQTGKDPFGNAVEREVAKRLNPTTPGEEQ